MDGIRHEEGKEYRVVFRGTKEQAEDLLKHMKGQGIDAKIVRRNTGVHDIYKASNPVAKQNA